MRLFLHSVVIGRGKDIFWVISVFKNHLNSTKAALDRGIALEAKLADLWQDHLFVRVQLISDHSVDLVDFVGRNVSQSSHRCEIPRSMNFIVPVLIDSDLSC